MAPSDEPAPVDYDSLATGAFEFLAPDSESEARWMNLSSQTRPTDASYAEIPTAPVFATSADSEERYPEAQQTDSPAAVDYAERKPKPFRIAIRMTPE